MRAETRIMLDYLQDILMNAYPTDEEEIIKRRNAITTSYEIVGFLESQGFLKHGYGLKEESTKTKHNLLLAMCNADYYIKKVLTVDDIELFGEVKLSDILDDYDNWLQNGTTEFFKAK